MKCITDDDVKTAFFTMMIKLIFAHQIVLKPLLYSLQGYDDKDCLLQIQEYESKLEKNMEQRQVLTSLLASVLLESVLLNRENNMLTLEEQRLQEEKNKVMHSVSGDRTRVDALQKLIKEVSGREILTEYDDELFLAHVNHIKVIFRDEVAFVMKCGLELKERMAG